MKYGPGHGIHPLDLGIQPQNLGNRIAWFLNKADKITSESDYDVTQWTDNFGTGNNITQATEAAKPLLLSWEGTLRNYLFLPGATGNYASTPDSAANSITGDIDIRCLCAPDSWTAGTFPVVSKMNGAGQRSFRFYVSVGGFLAFDWSENGTAWKTEISTAAVSFTGNGTGGIRVTLDAGASRGAYAVSFYQSIDFGDTWNLLWSGASALGVTSIFNSTADLYIGQTQEVTANFFAGKIWNLTIRNGIAGAGTVVVNFNCDKGSSYSDTFTAGTGEVWTILRDAVDSTYKAILVDETMICFNGANWLKSAAIAALDQPCTVYIFMRIFAFTANDRIYDGATAGTGQLRLTASPTIAAFAGTALANTTYTLGTFKIIAAVFNGASSRIKIDLSDAGVTGNAGTASMLGFTLGAAGNNANPINMAVKEAIIYDAAHDDNTIRGVMQGIAARHGYTIT